MRPFATWAKQASAVRFETCHTVAEWAEALRAVRRLLVVSHGAQTVQQGALVLCRQLAGVRAALLQASLPALPLFPTGGGGSGDAGAAGPGSQLLALPAPAVLLRPNLQRPSFPAALECSTLTLGLMVSLAR